MTTAVGLEVLGPIPIKPLGYTIHKSVDNGIFPELLKTGEVQPIPKKGDSNHIESYSPSTNSYSN